MALSSGRWSRVRSVVRWACTRTGRRHRCGGGANILRGSITSEEVPDGHAVYAASKAAIGAFARNWAIELKSRPIRVNVLSSAPRRRRSSTSLASRRKSATPSQKPWPTRFRLDGRDSRRRSRAQRRSRPRTPAASSLASTFASMAACRRSEHDCGPVGRTACTMFRSKRLLLREARSRAPLSRVQS
jgi:NAD(P)-dependent dehydrogenase (short-subunit alcohol dehydrogenase family)